MRVTGMRETRVGMVWLAAVMWAGAVWAETETKEAAVSMPELVVTATRTGEDPMQIPQSVLLVSEEEIAQKQPNQPIDILRDEPGVWIQQTGAGGGTPIIRGQMGNQVLYMVDGIRINNGRLFGGPNAFFNQVDVGSIAQVEVLKGPGSVQYGSDAMGGVVQMRTKTLDYFPESSEAGGQVSGHYSSADKGVYGHGEGWYAEEKMNIYVGGTYFDADNYRAGGDEGTLDNTSYRTRGGFGKGQLKLSDGHVLTVGYLLDQRRDVTRYDQSNRNQPSGLPRYFTPEEDRSIFYVRDHIENEGGAVTQIEPYLYYQNYYRKSDYYAESTSQIRTDVSDRNQDMYGGGIQAVSPIVESLKLVYGADARYENLRESKIRYIETKATGTTKSSEPTGNTPNGSYDVEDVFLMADWTPVERARITAGGRFESTHLKSDPDQNDVTDGFTVDDLTLDERWNAFTYSVGGLYWLTEALGVSSELATGYRAPTYSDVLSFGPFTYGVNVPSPDVGPEKSLSWEIGPRWNSESISFNAVYFHTWLTDIVASERVEGYTDVNGNGVEDPGEGNYAKENSGEGWIQGVESSGEWRFAEQWTVYGSFGWTEGRNEDTDDNLRFMAPVNGICGLRYRPTSKIGLQVYARMVAAQDKVSENDKRDPARASDPSSTFPSDSNPPLREDYSIPGYTTYHLRADYQATQWVKIFLMADNITDKEYRVAFSRQDAPGVSVTVGFEANF